MWSRHGNDLRETQSLTKLVRVRVNPPLIWPLSTSMVGLSHDKILLPIHHLGSVVGPLLVLLQEKRGEEKKRKERGGMS